MPNVEPQWQCTNCRTYNHHSQTYCPYCYELAPSAHNITPAKFGPDLTIGPFGTARATTLDYADTPSGKAALRGEYGNLVGNTIVTACHGKTAPTFDEYKRLVWARRKNDPSINRG